FVRGDFRRILPGPWRPAPAVKENHTMDIAQQPHLKAFAEALLSGLAPHFSKLEQNMAEVCSAVQKSQSTVPPSSSTVPHGDCCGSGAAGGACEGSCPSGGGAPNPIMQQIPACYGNCRTMSDCLVQYMKTARLLTDEGAWVEYQKSEI